MNKMENWQDRSREEALLYCADICKSMGKQTFDDWCELTKQMIADKSGDKPFNIPSNYYIDKFNFTKKEIENTISLIRTYG